MLSDKEKDYMRKLMKTMTQFKNLRKYPFEYLNALITKRHGVGIIEYTKNQLLADAIENEIYHDDTVKGEKHAFKHNTNIVLEL